MTHAELVAYFRSLDRHTRTVALVGEYLQSWSWMELELDEATAKALGLTGLQQYVLRSNVPFYKKIEIMRTLVQLALLTDTEKSGYDATLNKMGQCSAHRNIIAHDAFSSSQTNDGVGFLVYK